MSIYSIYPHAYAHVEPMCPTCGWVMPTPPRDEWARTGTFKTVCGNCCRTYTASSNLDWYVEQAVAEALQKLLPTK